jgi:NADPH:quinone reductase-like Zn-dependent oxidoreductase
VVTASSDWTARIRVASFAIQLAKHIGARVITTASAKNVSYLRELGADEVIDYNTTDFTKAVSNVDAGVRHRRRRRNDAVVRGAEARWPRGLHRLRHQGAGGQP